MPSQDEEISDPVRTASQSTFCYNAATGTLTAYINGSADGAIALSGSDNSGNQNLGFGVVDYKPRFDDETLEPKKRKNINSIKKSNQDGAF